jgi:hypothetical protein
MISSPPAGIPHYWIEQKVVKLACQAVQAEQSANLCPVANFVHQDVENNPSGCGSQKIVY